MSDLSVLVADDHRMFADAIGTVLSANGVDVAGIAASGREAVDLARATEPTVALVAFDMTVDGVTAVGDRIGVELPRTKVILTLHTRDMGKLADARRRGFHGMVVTDASIAKLMSAIRMTANGTISSVAGSPAARTVRRTAREEGEARLADQLTAREREVLRMLVEGATGTAIAEAFLISTNTVRSHIHNILTKLHAHSRLEAATYAVRFGLFDGVAARVAADVSQTA